MTEITILVPNWLGWLLLGSFIVAVVNSCLSIYDSYLKYKLAKLKRDE